MTVLTAALITVLTLSLVANGILFRSRNSYRDSLDFNRYILKMVEQGATRRINYLRGLLSRPWIDRHGRLQRTVR